MASLGMLLEVSHLHLDIKGRAANSTYCLTFFEQWRPGMMHTKISLLDEPLLGMRTEFIAQCFHFGKRTVTISSRDMMLSGTRMDQNPWQRNLHVSGAVFDHLLDRGHGTVRLWLEAEGPQSSWQRHKNLRICSDIQATLRALAASKTRSRLVGECKEALGMVAEHFLWIPEHTGIRGNEIADRLASLGVRSEMSAPEPFMEIAKSWARSIIKKWVSNSHSRWWAVTRESNHAKELLGPGEN